MVKKNIYDEKFYDVNASQKPYDDKDKFLNNRIDSFFDRKKDVEYVGTQGDYEIYHTPNKKKTFGHNIYFVDKNPNSYKVVIGRVKDNLKPYSSIKNSEIVYVGKLGDNSKDYIGSGLVEKTK